MILNYKNIFKRFFLIQSKWFMPRWLILLKDLFIVTFSFTAAYTLRFNFQLTNEIRYEMYNQLLLVLTISVIVFNLIGINKSIIRHTGARDVNLVLKAMAYITVITLVIQIVDRFIGIEILYYIPLSVLTIFFVLSFFIITVTRISVRLFYYWIKSAPDRINVMIYGAGSAGIITKNVLIAEQDNRIRIVGFIDQHPGKIGKTIEGTYVHSPQVLKTDFIEKNHIKEIIFAIQNIDKELKRKLIEEVLSTTKLKLKEISPVNQWIDGQLSVKQINTIKIEDLLQRSEISIDGEKMTQQLRGKNIMVTGAAGSIGSEIARQLCKLDISRLIFVDQAETPMYNLEMELTEKYKSKAHLFNFLIANVGDEIMMRRIFENQQPQIVFHAAAYKHVPLMEMNPFEAVRVNVMGTRNIANLASECRVERFVMISTDKAVNPTNVMGASKRAAEIYIQSLNHEISNHTRFITTRFGNVLGSNGSVIPLFEKQIAAGGPVTVTHPDITRYFMTIPEACRLVLEAGAMGNGGEIFMFDMGRAVKISDLAYNMIRLSGLEPEKDIKIVYTGLRPGEKLYEELLYDMEKGQPTHHPKISIAKVRYNRFSDVNIQLDALEISMESSDRFVVVRQLKRLVPEFKSNNSVFESLDDEIDETNIIQEGSSFEA